MIPRTDERQVPKGRARRIAIVFAARCEKCDWQETVTAEGAGAVRKPLYARGWRLRYGKWHCPECCGTRAVTTLRIAGGEHCLAALRAIGGCE